MTPSQDPFKSLRFLIEKALDGSISSEEMAQLEQAVLHDPEQRRYYCQYLYMTIGLLRCHSDRVPATGEQNLDNLLFSSLWNALSQEEQRAPSVETLNIEIPAPASPVPKEPQPQKVSFTLPVVAGACLAVLLLILGTSLIYQALVPHEVATLEQTMHATFQKPSPPVSGSRLTNRKAGWQLKTGLVEILFDSGAKVVIEAPASYQLSRADRMVLKEGRLFATVPPEAHGFTVETPDSHVIDLGTEFGIQVKQDGTSDLHMIKGKASLSTASKHSSQASLIINAGQARRILLNGNVQKIPLNEQGFVRRFNAKTSFVWRGEGLSLADLVGQGNGLGTGRTNTFLDPIAGYQNTLYSTSKGNQYHLLATNPFIDGLFIPDGHTPQIVTSQGQIFKDCPLTNGECYAALSANPRPGLYLHDRANQLDIRVVDPSAQGTAAFVLADEAYTVTGREKGVEWIPEEWTKNQLGSGAWIHFQLRQPVHLAPGKQYGFDVTVTAGNRDFCLETAGVAQDLYAGGSAYSTGTKGGTNSLHLDNVYAGDHTFIVALTKNNPRASAPSGELLSYQAQRPQIGPEDVTNLRESTLDNQNVVSFPGQTFSGDNDQATYIAQDRYGLGQTFTTGHDPNGYLMKSFWLKNVRYKANLPQGNGTWCYVNTQQKTGVIRFNGIDYGNHQHPCLVMHANLGITFDINALRTQGSGMTLHRCVCRTGVADFNEAEPCCMDFWILVDGQVRASQRNVTHKGLLNDLSVQLYPSDRFLTLVTTDDQVVNGSGTLQRPYPCDWGVFVEPRLLFDSK